MSHQRKRYPPFNFFHSLHLVLVAHLKKHEASNPVKPILDSNLKSSSQDLAYCFSLAGFGSWMRRAGATSQGGLPYLTKKPKDGFCRRRIAYCCKAPFITHGKISSCMYTRTSSYVVEGVSEGFKRSWHEVAEPGLTKNVFFCLPISCYNYKSIS